MTWLLALKQMPWRLIGWCALGFALVAMFAALRMEQAQNAKLKAQVHACSEARKADQANYARAQAEAQARNHTQVVKIEQQQQRITTDAQESYTADLARLRAELNVRLRPQNGTAQGAADKPGASPVPSATTQPDAGSRVSIPTDLYVHGAELELQLEHLQLWVKEQLAVTD